MLTSASSFILNTSSLQKPTKITLKLYCYCTFVLWRKFYSEIDRILFQILCNFDIRFIQQLFHSFEIFLQKKKSNTTKVEKDYSINAKLVCPLYLLTPGPLVLRTFWNTAAFIASTKYKTWDSNSGWTTFPSHRLHKLPRHSTMYVVTVILLQRHERNDLGGRTSITPNINQPTRIAPRGGRYDTWLFTTSGGTM